MKFHCNGKRTLTGMLQQSQPNTVIRQNDRISLHSTVEPNHELGYMIGASGLTTLSYTINYILRARRLDETSKAKRCEEANSAYMPEAAVPSSKCHRYVRRIFDTIVVREERSCMIGLLLYFSMLVIIVV